MNKRPFSTLVREDLILAIKQSLLTVHGDRKTISEWLEEAISQKLQSEVNQRYEAEN